MWSMALLERESQLDALAGYLAEAAEGRGRLVYVAGEAGIGKTTFIEAFRERCTKPRPTVAVGWCDGSATPVPLGPLSDMLPDLPDGVWPEGASRPEVSRLLLGMLRRPAGPTPFVLVVEDAHWADEATLELLRHLARRIHTCHALVLVTYRPEDTHAGDKLRVLLGDTASASGTRRVDLGGLTLRAVTALVGDDGTDPDQLYALTGGNPFFVTEVLEAGSADLPPTVRDAVLARTARLGETGRRALDVVALAGARAELDLVQDLLNAGPSALDEPLQRGLLRVNGPDVLFRHELARMAVADEIPAGRRVHLHRRLLEALTTRGGDPARLAHHADACGDGARVVRHGREAGGRAAALGSHREAARQLRRALDHVGSAVPPLEPAEHAQLLWDLGYEYYLTGGVDTAVEAISAARAIWEDLGDTVRVGDAWRCQSRLHWFAGRNRLAEEQAQTAVDLLDGTASVEEAMAYSHRTGLEMLRTDLQGTRDWGRRTLALVERLPDSAERDEVRVHALATLGTMEVTSGDLADGERMLVESLTAARAAAQHEHAARALNNLAAAAVAQRRFDDAARYLDEAYDYCVDRDLDSWTTYVLGMRSEMLLDLGDHAGARSSAQEVVARRTETTPMGVLAPLTVLGSLESRTGGSGAGDLLAEARALADPTAEPQKVAPTTAAICVHAWIRGEPSEAESAASRVWPLVLHADCPWNRGSIATWLPPGLDVAVPLGEPFALQREGRWAEAADWWARAGCRFDQGLALARSGDPELLVEATAVFDRVGASAAASRARALLRGTGAAVPRATSARQHPAGLTARQEEVHALLRQGRTDAQIAVELVISRRTAEHHVAAVLDKLGARSRRDLLGSG